MPEYHTLDQSTGQFVDVTLKQLQGKLDMQSLEDQIGLSLLTKFDALIQYENVFVHKVTQFSGTHGSFILLLAEKQVPGRGQEKTGRDEKPGGEPEPMLIFNLAHDLGKAFIRQETASDKILDVLLKVDVDFDDYPEFSKNYYVIGEDEDRIRQYMPVSLIRALSHVSGLVVEINGNAGLIRTGKNLSAESLALLMKTGSDIIQPE
jgi:hypothetical protein